MVKVGRFLLRIINHGVIRQDYQRWYFNTNSGTIYLQDASWDILIHITFMLIDII